MIEIDESFRSFQERRAWADARPIVYNVAEADRVGQRILLNRFVELDGRVQLV
jgi:hypothetical protein